jgi:hypothetical protein
MLAYLFMVTRHPHIQNSPHRNTRNVVSDRINHCGVRLRSCWASKMWQYSIAHSLNVLIISIPFVLIIANLWVRSVHTFLNSMQAMGNERPSSPERGEKLKRRKLPSVAIPTYLWRYIPLVECSTSTVCYIAILLVNCSAAVRI